MEMEIGVTIVREPPSIWDPTPSLSGSDQLWFVPARPDSEPVRGVRIQKGGLPYRAYRCGVCGTVVIIGSKA
jgi:hypothetical protein